MKTKTDKLIKKQNLAKQASKATSKLIIVSSNGKPRKNYSPSVPPNPYKLKRITIT